VIPRLHFPPSPLCLFSFIDRLTFPLMVLFPSYSSLVKPIVSSRTFSYSDISIFSPYVRTRLSLGNFLTVSVALFFSTPGLFTCLLSFLFSPVSPFTGLQQIGIVILRSPKRSPFPVPRSHLPPPPPILEIFPSSPPIRYELQDRTFSRRFAQSFPPWLLSPFCPSQTFVQVYQRKLISFSNDLFRPKSHPFVQMSSCLVLLPSFLT